MLKYASWGGSMNSTERWVSLSDICKHLGFSKDTVKKLVMEQGMPAYKPDNKIWKFKISEVDAWVKTKRINATGVETNV